MFGRKRNKFAISYFILRLLSEVRRSNRLNKIIIQNQNEIRSLIMASKQEVLDAIAAEKAEVAQKLTDLETQIQALKDQIAAGSPVTAEDLDEIVAAVNDIFVA